MLLFPYPSQANRHSAYIVPAQSMCMHASAARSTLQQSFELRKAEMQIFFFLQICIYHQSLKNPKLKFTCFSFIINHVAPLVMLCLEKVFFRFNYFWRRKGEGEENSRNKLYFTKSGSVALSSSIPVKTCTVFTLPIEWQNIYRALVLDSHHKYLFPVSRQVRNAAVFPTLQHNYSSVFDPSFLSTLRRLLLYVSNRLYPDELFHKAEKARNK